MSKRQQLNLYIQQVQQRLRLDAGLRGGGGYHVCRSLSRRSSSP